MDLYACEILLVDDNRELQEMLREMLEREGYQKLRQAYSCREAREMFARRPQLVVLDVMLPDGDGFSLFREFVFVGPGRGQQPAAGAWHGGGRLRDEAFFAPRIAAAHPGSFKEGLCLSGAADAAEPDGATGPLPGGSAKRHGGAGRAGSPADGQGAAFI